ncbi:MAG: alkaline phosphatase family protein [Clostridiales bacterium]|nr:alkaline phosphatase family protein [Clostridiales bacterium]
MNRILITFLLYIFIINSTISTFKLICYDSITSSKKSNDKICLIIIDGLRLDTISSMPFIKNLIDSNIASFSISKAEKPTLSRPGYMRILTGSPTNINGIFSNIQHIPSPILGISDLALYKKLKTSLCGYFWVYELFPFTFHNKNIYYIRDGKTFSDSMNILSKYSPDFFIIHPMSVDNAGHKFGGYSNEYKNEAIKIDYEISKLYKTLIDNNYSIIITSDHGHLNFGGHELYHETTFLTPFVFINSSHKKVNIPFYIDQIDIAPTICDLLGIPKTLYMTGNSFIDNNNIEPIRKPHILNSNLTFAANLKFSLSITILLQIINLITFILSCIIIFKLQKN